jgi:RNA polymerase sigma factor (sigma-70 family)
MVFGICRATLRDPHEAEDATQQTFLSAYRSLLGGARVRDDGAWLATIARNECRARIAAGMRKPLPVADEDLEAIPAIGDETERRAQAEEFRVALSELPERQQEAVVLRHLYGLSYGEVGRALGLSRPATEALLFRARRAMRLRLKPAVATAIAVPISVQESLAEAIPGFGAAGAGALVGGAAGGGLLAKLASAPVAAKVATAAVAVTTVGVVGSIESERAGRDRAEHGGIVTTVGQRWSDDGTGVSDQSGRDETAGGDSVREDGSDDGVSSGPGSDNSGPGSNDDRELDDDASSGEGSGDDTSSSGGSDDDGGGDSKSDDTSDDSGGSGSSGSGSGSSGSSSDDGSTEDDAVDDSSDGGSDDGGESSSGSGSGSSSSGSGSDDGGGSDSGSDDDSSGSDSSGKGKSGGSDDDEPDPDD